MKLITTAQRRHLEANWLNREREDHDPLPVVKIFLPWTGATWLITEADPSEPELLFGLCDLGLGSPELGYVSLREIEAIKGPGGLRAERDRHFEAEAPLSVYADQARLAGGISA